MSLPSGTRLGVYEVGDQIGEGGMGQVYRATDTTLGRQVAIKILPAAFALDAERVARFEREAKTLALLNHPHIASIYGFEKSSGAHALVMELVDGEDLSQRIRAGGALPINEVIAIAKQIAEALAEAHERGIVHRDLKPANIKVTPDGVVKVLDFGLAKAMDSSAASESGSINVANSPTITTPAMTQAGMILGTAAYMSPEQSKGRVADKRSDIWSFGCVLYEMLTGHKAFDGEDVSETLAAILRAEPEWARLPATTPANLRTLVEGCLKKDRKQRIADIAVAQYLLSGERASNVTAVSSSSRTWRIAAAILAVTTIGALGAAAYLSRPQPAPPSMRFLIDAADKTAFVTGARTGASAAIAPDGTRLAYTLRDESGKVLIWIRALDSLTAQPLPGTDDAGFPFWSPDSKSIGYFAGGKLLKINAAGGPPQTLCNAEGARGGAWGPNGEIVFGGGTGSGLSRVSAAGGDPVEVTKADTGDHRFPTFLPDGRHVLFYRQSPGTADAGLYIASLDSGEIRRLAVSETTGVYAPQGFVLFTRQTTLVAQPFDAGSLSLTGDPVPIAEHVESGVYGGVLAFSVSNTGTLAYGIGIGRETALQLTWLDRDGKVLQSVGQLANYAGIELSPDGTQLAAHRHELGTGGDLWLIDLLRGTTSRFTFDPAQDNSSPVWSPDGKRIAFASLRNGEFKMFEKVSNGGGNDRPFEFSESASPRSWSPDGKFLVYGSVSKSDGSNAWMLPLAGGKSEALLTSRFFEWNPIVSPDGKWLAFSSNETGQQEVYVRPFPHGDGQWQVSTTGGNEPRWRGDSKELFYLDRAQLGSMMAVEVNGAGATFVAGTPRRLFATNMLGLAHPGPPGWWRYAVAHDGKKFLLPINPRATTYNDAASAPMAVVTNWTAGLKK